MKIKLQLGVSELRRSEGFPNLFSSRKACKVVAVCDHDLKRVQQWVDKERARAYDDYDIFCILCSSMEGCVSSVI